MLPSLCLGHTHAGAARAAAVLIVRCLCALYFGCTQVLREPRLYLDQRLELKSLMASLTGTNEKGSTRTPALHVSVSATPPGRDFLFLLYPLPVLGALLLIPLLSV